jgi:hypothetical protein
VCTLGFVRMCHEKMISVPVTSFSRAKSIQVVIAAVESNDAPGVTEVNRSVFSAGTCFEIQKPTLIPMKTETKAMASSKQG